MRTLPFDLSKGDATLPRLLLHWAEVQPDRLALREKDLGIWQRVTWRQYADNVRHFAAALEGLGFKAGDRLAIAGEGTPEWLYADLATQALGGRCVGLYPTSPWQELTYILQHSKARVVVCADQEQTDKILDALAYDSLPDLEWIVCVDPRGMRNYTNEKLVMFDDLLAQGAKADGPAAVKAFSNKVNALVPDDRAIIVYTSGTTGKPKGAEITHRNLLVSASGVLKGHGYSGPNQEVVCYLPLCHVAERSFSTVMQLCQGSIVNFAESVDTVTSDLREIAPTLFLGVPRIWEKMQQTIMIKLRESYTINRKILDRAFSFATEVARKEITPGQKPSAGERAILGLMRMTIFRNLRRYTGLHRCRSAFCGAASVSPEVLLFFRAIGLPIYQVYGMTETAAVAIQQVPGHETFGCVGVPSEGVEFRIAEDGELLMRGDSIFAGYLDAPEATAAAFKDGWLMSGDIARVVNGEVQIVDRKKDLIVTSGGKNISPSEVENALKDSTYIREAIVVGDGRNFVSALIQIDHDTVAKWAQEKELSFTTFKSLVNLAEVRALIDAEVRQANERFARVSHVRKFVLLDKELDHDDGELTATMKVRRTAIEAKYVTEIQSIYGAKA